MWLVRLRGLFYKRSFLLLTQSAYRVSLVSIARIFPRLSHWRLVAVVTLSGCVGMKTLLAENQDSDLLDEDLERIVTQADLLFENNEFEKLLEFLSQYSDYNEPKLLWRLSRANYKVAKEKNTTQLRGKELSYKAVELVEQSLALDPNSFAAHKWAGIALSHIGSFEGLTSKIKRAYTIKSHFEKSLKFKPNEPTSLHLLGQWCYQIAEISWFERRVVSTILATPPTSSFEEALDCFKRAEEVEPGFYSMNWLYLAKTLMKLNRKSEATHWLDKLCSYKAANEEDETAIQEGREMKKGM